MIILDAIRRWIGKMLPKKSVEQKLHIQIATSVVMDNAILLWLQMYRNQPPWMGGRNRTQCLNLPASIAEEMARLVLTEFELRLDGRVDGHSESRETALNERSVFLQIQLEPFLVNLNNSVEMWCALGGVVLKPYAAGQNPETGNPNRIAIDVVRADRFYPTAFNSNGDVTGAVFMDSKRIGDYVYTRLEYHSLMGTHYTVLNKAYRSERLQSAVSEEEQITVELPFSQEVPLESVDEWRGLSPVVEMDGVETPLFAYIRTPRANNKDPSSPLGASVFSRAEDAIKEADIQYTRILREYKVKEAFIQADETLFDRDRDGNPVLPEGEERVYRTYRFDNASAGGKNGFIETYSPEIRDASLFNGLNRLYQNIEFLCGLAYGTLSDLNFSSNAEKTATEIKYSKQRSYTTVHAMQKAWEAGLLRMLNAMDTLCTLYGMAPEGELAPVITWGDGVLEDTDIEYQRRWAMVLAGKLKLESFYAWYFGCSEESARKLIPTRGQYPPVE